MMTAGSAFAGADPITQGRGLLPADPEQAEAMARQLLRRQPRNAEAMRLLAAALRGLNRSNEADRFDLAAIEASASNPAMVTAIRHLLEGRLQQAERIARQRLAAEPDDVAVICLLADIAYRVGIYAESENLLRRALAIAPNYAEAAIKLAQTVFQQNRAAEAVALFDGVLEKEPDNALAAGSRIRILGLIGQYDEAATACRALVEQHADNAFHWINYANVLKTVGRSEEAVSAYRRATAIDPDLGLGWWSISNLKGGHLDAADIRSMLSALDSTALDQTARLHLHFALGKAYEDAGDYKQSFGHYARANQIRLGIIPHDRREITDLVGRSCEIFGADFVTQRAGWGAPGDDPVFILGMPRAGSTLIEQILSSHPAIEGTSELSDIPLLVHKIVADRWQDRDAAYPDIVPALDPATTKSLGEDYLRTTRVHRQAGRPRFIDKLPNNWLYVGFIHLILPNAKIIDARREAMACCFSNFKQHFARGQPFAYSLADLGAYYRDYVRLMAHFDKVLPGVVHRVQHEALLDDPEGEVRRLLDYLGLPFDDACLRFHENARPVRTASSEQVRRPINRDAVDQWRNYEPWLGELKAALGDLV